MTDILPPLRDVLRPPVRVLLVGTPRGRPLMAGRPGSTQNVMLNTPFATTVKGATEP